MALFGPAVTNQGTIDAPNGTAALVSSGDILFAPSGPDAFYVTAPVKGAGGAASVDNSGVIKAAQVELKAAGSPYALAVNNSGAISATAVHEVGGRVVLDAGNGKVAVSGTITARSGDQGGFVDILGRNVHLFGSAVVDVSGAAGGGTVRIGGGAHGTDISVQNALTTTVDPGATIRANATANGNGGSVVVWSDNNTQFAGTIDAQGGAQGGNGGQVEVSGARSGTPDSRTRLRPTGPPARC